MAKNSEMISDLLAKQGCETTWIQEDDGGGYTVVNVAVPGWGDIEISVTE